MMKTFLKTRGLQVATLAEGSIVGKFDDLLFELESGRIFGYRLRQGVLRSGGVAAASLTRIGRDLVYVQDERAVDWSGLTRVADEGRAWALQYRGARVMSRRGAALGEVQDFVIDTDPRHAVYAFLLDANRIVRFDERVSVGRDALIVDDAAAALGLDDDEPETTDWWIRVRQAFGSMDGKGPPR